MSRFCPINLRRTVLSILGSLAFSGALIQPSLAAEPVMAAEESNAAKNLARMNCGAKIDCSTPDGRLVAVLSAGEKNSSAAALIMDDDTLSCPLQEGETTFNHLIPENVAARPLHFRKRERRGAGRNENCRLQLPAPRKSPKWTDVSGKTEFTSKRLFQPFDGRRGSALREALFPCQKGRPHCFSRPIWRRFAREICEPPNGVIRIANKLTTHRLEDMLNFNFAKPLREGTRRVCQFGSARGSRSMIDDDTMTAFHFAPSDSHPTVIVELTARERLHRVSAPLQMHSRTAGCLSVERACGKSWGFDRREITFHR